MWFLWRRCRTAGVVRFLQRRCRTAGVARFLQRRWWTAGGDQVWLSTATHIAERGREDSRFFWPGHHSYTCRMGGSQRYVSRWSQSLRPSLLASFFTPDLLVGRR